MFNVLLESCPRPVQNLTRALTSLALHAVLLGAALAVPRPAATPRPKPSVDSISLYVRSDPVPAMEARSSTGIPAPPRAPTLQPDAVMPTIAPADLSTALPSVLDLVRRTQGSPAGSLTRPGRSHADGIKTVDVVDEPVVPLEQPNPDYPPALAQAGINGWVELSYVVDTLGRVEPESIDPVGSTHPAFEAAARVAVLASRFKPATLRGRPVRQLVRQRLSFRLAGSRPSW